MQGVGNYQAATNKAMKNLSFQLQFSIDGKQAITTEQTVLHLGQLSWDIETECFHKGVKFTESHPCWYANNNEPSRIQPQQAGLHCGPRGEDFGHPMYAEVPSSNLSINQF